MRSTAGHRCNLEVNEMKNPGLRKQTGVENGASEEIRTLDNYLGKVELYH